MSVKPENVGAELRKSKNCLVKICWSPMKIEPVTDMKQREILLLSSLTHNKQNLVEYFREGNGDHSSPLAWKIPRTEEPGRLQSMGSLSRTRLSDFTFTFHFHALEKKMATHSSVLAWRIPGTGEPGGLPSMRSHRVGHN